MYLNERELALALASLRHLQALLLDDRISELSTAALAILDDAALADDAIHDIDVLCEKVTSLG